MTGKIFPESNNVYQDQAKILFNYYSQAAEKIVAEEYPLRTSVYSCQLAEDLDNKYWRIVDIVETINNIVMDLKL